MGRRPVRQTELRISSLGGLLALLVTVVGVVAATPGPARADTCPFPLTPSGDCPIRGGVPIVDPREPGGPGATIPPGDPIENPTSGRVCYWFPYDDQAHWRSVFPEAPPDAQFGETRCWLDGRAILGPYVPTWRVPGEPEAPPPPTPAEAAQILWLEVEDLLKRPEVVTDPPSGTASILDIPTFVAVSNWEGTVSPPEQCLLGVCITFTAEPTLTFDPGETGAPPITCEDGGTRYDPAGPEPDEQAAAPGACAYAYQRRTGTAGRPEAWTATVTVTWEVTWELTGGPSGGGITAGTIDPPPSLSATFTRPVHEVQGVIVTGAG